MSQIRTLYLALFTVFALAAAFTASTAFAELPDVHLLSGEEYGIGVRGTGSIGNGEKVVAEFETEIGEKLTIRKVRVTTVLLELSALGPGTLEFTGVEEPKSKTVCNSPGDPAGTVLLPGEDHVVFTSLPPAGLEIGLLILFNELTVECNSGKIKIKIKAPVIAKLTKINLGDTLAYGVVLNCTAKGKQELKEYDNEEGKKVTATLAVNFGLGAEKACERAGQELVITSEKMLEFLF